MQPILHLPFDRLLISGGDTRLLVDSSTGINRYGCRPRPCNAVAFGSCTSSSVSRRGFAAADEARRIVRNAEDPQAAGYDCCRAIRRKLRQCLRIAEDVDIALAPSGTDVELLALALAAGGKQRRTVNIVVGPSEVGSGGPAAACCHYDRLSPHGIEVAAGEPIDRSLASRVDVQTVDIRAENGDTLAVAEIDDVVTHLVTKAADQDAVVLLHVVAHSKTGIHAPSLACVERLRRSYPDIVVVIDAAQGRFSRRGLRQALDKKYLVMFTGSKFFGGPPFSGALFVPQELHPAKRQLDKLPEGFSDYFSAAEMPESWPDIRRSLPAEPNFGAILRWSAAAAQIDAYYGVPGHARLRVLRVFEAEAPRILGASKIIRLLPTFPPLLNNTEERLLQSKTTVFGFWVTPPGRAMPLNKAELWELHAELNTDRSVTNDGSHRRILEPMYHVGQPVDLGRAGHVLRVALGGELIVRVAIDESLGQSFEQRLAWLGGQLTGLRRKIECLVDHRFAAEPVAAALEPVETGMPSALPTAEAPYPAAFPSHGMGLGEMP